MPDQPLAETPQNAAGQALAWRDLVVVLIGVVATVTVAFVHRSNLVGSLALAAVVAVSTWLAVIDFREHRLPNRIVGPLAIAVVVGLVVAGFVEEDLSRTGRAIGFGVATAAVLLVANLIGGLGMGDVKYGFPMAATVGWFGVDALFVALFVTTLGGGVVAAWILLSRSGRNRELAYGPYMALGLAISLILTGL